VTLIDVSMLLDELEALPVAKLPGCQNVRAWVGAQATTMVAFDARAFVG
jgi:hypothetical protein